MGTQYFLGRGLAASVTFSGPGRGMRTAPAPAA